MSKKVLVLSGSPKKNGNSSILCDQFIKGAEEAGNTVEKLYIKDKEINYCVGCAACQRNNGVCIHKDDMPEILNKMIEADVIVLSTPIYFYSMDAQMKTVIDRTFARYREMKDKELYIIVTGGADAEHYFETAIDGLKGFAVCLPNAKINGIIYGINSSEAGDVRNTEAMSKTYEMGKFVK